MATERQNRRFYDPQSAEGKKYAESARSILRGVHAAERDIETTLEEMARLHALRTRITSVLRETTSGGGGRNGADARANATAELIEREKRLQDRINVYTDRLDRAEAAINGLASPRQRDVMRRRYLLGWGFKRIADDIGLELNTVYHLHGRALYHIGKAAGKEA